MFKTLILIYIFSAIINMFLSIITGYDKKLGTRMLFLSLLPIINTILVLCMLWDALIQIIVLLMFLFFKVRNKIRNHEN